MRILFFFSITFLTGSWSIVNGQYYDQTIGFRAGTSFEASYKRFIFYTPDVQQALEVLAGFQLDENVPMVAYDIPENNGFVLEGLWLCHLDIGFDTNFSGFAGGGAYFGGYVESGKSEIFFGGGLTLLVGMEYSFTHVPISVSIDWKPLIGYPRLSLARGALTLRYILPTPWQ